MAGHWPREHGPGWARRAAINGVGAVFTTVALAIELLSKFTEGAWLVVIVVPALVLMFSRVHSTYWRIGVLLGLGRTPPRPHPQRSLVVVPVAGLSGLTEDGISAALPLGDEVRAVPVSYADTDDEEAQARLAHRWDEWPPDAPLVTLPSRHRSLGPPVVRYLREQERADPSRRV